jgi:peptide/nickel transport system substrate-binding protein
VRRRHVAALLCAAVLGALLAAPTASTAEAPTTLIIEVPGPFAGCDPGSPTTTAATDAVLSLVLPSAFTPGAQGTVSGDTEVVAEAEVVGLAPQTVVYTIATGATWPDGQPFGTQDLVRTWLERRGDPVAGDLGYREIAYMHPSPNGQSVTVGFRSPYSDWASLFDLVVPAATATARCSEPSATLDPSMGPYEIVTADRDRIVLRTNPAWTGALPGFTNVVVVDRAPRPLHFGVARTVYLPAPSLASLEAVTSSGTLSSRMDRSTTVVSYDFAVRGTEGLSLEVRQGLALLVDRAAIVDRFAAPVDDRAAPEPSHLFGAGDPNYSGPVGAPVSHPQLPVAPVPGSTGAAAYGTVDDVAAADAALRAAGLRKGSSGWQLAGAPLSICLAVPATDSTLQDVGHAIASELTAQGIAVQVRQMPSVAMVAASLAEGECSSGVLERTGDGFVTHSAADWLAPSAPAPTGLLWTGVDDPAVTVDAQNASAILNPVDAAASWDAMDDRLWDLMAGLPLYSPSAYVGWSLSVAGVLPCSSLAGFVSQVPSLLPVAERV